MKRDFFNIAAFQAATRPPARLMGLDLGTKTIGIALSDVEQRLATPAETIRRTRFSNDAAALIKIIEEQDVKGIVLGYPLNMDDTPGPRCQATRQFATNLLKIKDISLICLDERMTSQEAHDVLKESALNYTQREKHLDAVAASLILGHYLKDYLLSHC